MKNLELVLYIILTLTLVIIFFFARKIKKPIRNMLFSVAISFIILMIINLISFVTGIYIPINPYSVVTTAVYGVPGIAGLIALCTVFGI